MSSKLKMADPALQFPNKKKVINENFKDFFSDLSPEKTSIELELEKFNKISKGDYLQCRLILYKINNIN
jgi:hypothetical protein